MPMIDVYAAAGTFSDKHGLAQNLANAVMRWEKVPPINLFKNNTAAFIHELPAESISNAAGESNYVRVQVLTPHKIQNLCIPSHSRIAERDRTFRRHACKGKTIRQTMFPLAVPKKLRHTPTF